VEDLPDIETIPTPAACSCARRLLDGLRPSYAEVIQRIDLDGEDPASAAAALGISQGNLDVRLHRARKSLRNEVCTYCGVGSSKPCLDCACDGQHRCGSPA
jgi:RNA polymerase sigma-70 factor (ECF subfamily)